MIYAFARTTTVAVVAKPAAMCSATLLTVSTRVGGAMRRYTRTQPTRVQADDAEASYNEARLIGEHCYYHTSRKLPLNIAPSAKTMCMPEAGGCNYSTELRVHHGGCTCVTLQM